MLEEHSAKTIHYVIIIAKHENNEIQAKGALANISI